MIVHSLAENKKKEKERTVLEHFVLTIMPTVCLSSKWRKYQYKMTGVRIKK